MKVSARLDERIDCDLLARVVLESLQPPAWRAVLAPALRKVAQP